MPHALVAFVGIEKPAKTIGNRLAGMKIIAAGLGGPVGLRAVVQFHGSQRRLHFFFAEQSVVAEGFVPLCQMFEIGIDAAIAECGGS